MVPLLPPPPIGGAALAARVARGLLDRLLDADAVGPLAVLARLAGAVVGG